MSQIGTPITGGAQQTARPRSRAKQRHKYKPQRIPSVIYIDDKTRVQDKASLNALRHNLASSLMELLRESRESGNSPRCEMGREGYAVYRVWINNAELLMAVQERKQGMHVKYVYFDGSAIEPKAYEFFVPHSNGTKADERHRVSNG